MGRAPCCDKAIVKRGPWSPEEDAILRQHIQKFGTGGNWIALPSKAGLKRCGKSCRLRWLNYLRPNIKHGHFSDHEDRIICSLFTTIGSRWSIIAAQLPGRTDNDIKNYWNTKLKKKLIMGLISIPEIKPNPAAVSSLSGASPPPHTEADVWSLAGPANPSLGCSNNMQRYNNFYDHQIQENFLSFGGEASCSSSDGSCGGGHLGYGGGGGEEMVHFGNGFYGDVESGVWNDETQLDYCLEEIKRLISCSDNNNKNNNNIFN